MFSNLIAFISAVEGVDPLRFIEDNAGFIRNEAERRDFSNLVWEYLLPLEQYGCKDSGFSPILLDRARLSRQLEAAALNGSASLPDLRRLYGMAYRLDQQFGGDSNWIPPVESAVGVEVNFLGNISDAP